MPSSTSPLAGLTALFVLTSSPARLAWYMSMKEQGLRLVVIEPQEFRKEEFVDVFHQWIQMETDSTSAMATAVKEQVDGTVNAVLSFDEYGVFAASELAEALSCRPIPLPPAGMRATHVKTLFREWCDTHHIGSPKAVSLPNPQCDAKQLLSTLSFPIVVKPSPGAGSMLAKKCGDIDDALSHLDRMWEELLSSKARKYLDAFGPTVHVVAEEYVGGQEVDVDCVIENGQVRFAAISDNFEVQPPYFAEQGGVLPSELPDDKLADVRALLESFAKSHNKDLHGVLHFEAKYDFQRGKPMVIEVNCRPGSAETDVLVTTVYGVPLGEIHTRLALGLPIDELLNSEPKTVAASVNLYPSTAGKVISMTAPTADPSFVDWRGTPAGRMVAPPPQMFGCVAWMVAKGDNVEAAKSNIKRLSDCVKMDIEPQ